jgi:CcmD family protein
MKPVRIVRLVRVASVAFALWLCTSAPSMVRAEEGQTPGDRAQSFQAVQGAVKEDVAGGPLLLGAYAFVWIALLGYVLRIAKLQNSANADIERLSRALSDLNKR